MSSIGSNTFIPSSLWLNLKLQNTLWARKYTSFKLIGVKLLLELWRSSGEQQRNIVGRLRTFVFSFRFLESSSALPDPRFFRVFFQAHRPHYDWRIFSDRWGTMHVFLLMLLKVITPDTKYSCHFLRLNLCGHNFALKSTFLFNFHKMCPKRA